LMLSQALTTPQWYVGENGNGDVLLMSLQFVLCPLHLDHAQEFPHEIFNILRIENNLGFWHHIMASTSWMQGYIIYQLMKSRSYYLTTTYLVHLTLLLLQIWHMTNIVAYLPWPTDLLTNKCSCNFCTDMV
jgi:hypothetical protein